MIAKELLDDLFARGLGDLLVLHVASSHVLLGHVMFEKGRMILKDMGYAKGVKPEQVATCIEAGTLGAVCSMDGREWETLTLLGMEYCHVSVDLSATRTNLLACSSDQNGDNLIGFDGSIYRGFKLMLESHLLPVVVMKPVTTRKGVTGLAVCDLRLASVPLNTIHLAYEHQQQYVAKHMTVQVDDYEVDSEQFTELFGNFLQSA